jgi:hypothetical protein
MIRESIPAGRIAGIPVRLNVSLFVILGILVVTLATGLLPALSPGAMGHEYVTAAVVAAPLFLLSLLAHELSHAIVARRNGIDVAGITLWLFGGVAELKRLPATARADLRVAIVGPLTSLGVAVGSLTRSRGRSGPPASASGWVDWECSRSSPAIRLWGCGWAWSGCSCSTRQPSRESRRALWTRWTACWSATR